MIRFAPASRLVASFASSSAALALFLVAAPAVAQDETPKPASAAAAAASEAKPPSLSLALERAGGIGYAKATSTEGTSDSSVSLTALGVGGVTLNPFAVPRVGLDFILPSNLTLGGAVGFTRLSGSTSAGSQSEDIGSAVLYCLIGCGVARIIGTPIADFWRWRGALAIIGFSATALVVAHAVLGRVA